MMTPDANKEKARSSPAERHRICFTDIPYVHRVFVDFLYAFARVREFYGPVQRSDRPLSAWAEEVAARARWRNLLVEVLHDQNRRFGSDDRTFAAIDRLADPRAVAVVTGQQAGLFTGPLLTLYKALTAVVVAADLCDRGITAVPLFWINSEDHDWEEVNHCQVVGRDGQWCDIRYAGADEDLGKPVADILLTADIDRVIGDLLAALPPSEFLPRIEADLRATYVTGARFVEGFARLLARLTAGSGLILLDPSDARLKPALAPLFRQVLMCSRSVSEALGEQRERLQQQGYRPPLHWDQGATLLFLLDHGKRRALVRRDDRLSVKGSATTFTEAEVLDLLAAEPHRFSPGVAMRPLAQDTLLPTLVYVAGPTEIAYFAQLAPLYRAFDIIEPLIWPRASLTLIEPRYASLMARYALQVTDLFAGAEAVRARIVERFLKDNDLAHFHRAEDVIAEELTRLRQILADIDPTLDRPAMKAIEKVRHQVESLRRHYSEARSRRDTVLSEHIRRLTILLAPGKKLQERTVNGFYFFARYGYGILERVRREIDPHCPDHQVVFL